jgi:hypothetical protein
MPPIKDMTVKVGMELTPELTKLLGMADDLRAIADKVDSLKLKLERLAKSEPVVEEPVTESQTAIFLLRDIRDLLLSVQQMAR